MEKYNKHSFITASAVIGVFVFAVAVWQFNEIKSFIRGGILQSATVISGTFFSSDNFAVLASTYGNTGATTITGDLGYTSGPGVAPTVSGTLHSSADSTYNQGGTNQNSLLTTLNAQTCDFNLGSDTDLSLRAQPLAPGVYCVTGAISIGTGGIRLSSGQTYIFRPTGALTSVDNSIVTLDPGTSVCDIFWTPGGSTTLGANSTFAGTDIDASGITVGNTSTWTGRALAFGGTITTVTDTITSSACTSPVVIKHHAHNNTNSLITFNLPVAPLIGILNVPSPLSLLAGPSIVTYNYTVWNVGGLQALNDVVVTDDKCYPLVLISGDVNGNGKIDITESWKYSCMTKLATTTTNTAFAEGYSNDASRQKAIAQASATVVVGSPLIAPLVAIIKVPSQLTPFPFGGGDVTYTYTVTNPGLVSMHNVVVTDDKCALVSRIAGDTNSDNILDITEAWVYTCKTQVTISTKNTATVIGYANGFTAVGHAFATVLVALPRFPTTGLPPEENLPILSVPISLAIPKINVDATLESVGLTSAGILDVPIDPTHAAWFDLSPNPGKIGNAVIDGHFGTVKGVPAVFNDLNKLQAGDQIYVTDSTGKITTFVVRAVRTYNENAHATEVFSSHDGKAHLNIITCQGIWNKIKKSYSNRLVVFTDLVQS